MSQSTTRLIHIHLDEQDREGLSCRFLMSYQSMYRVWNVVQHKMQVRLAVIIDLEVMLEFNDIWVAQQAHNLEFATLIPLVQQHFLDANLRSRTQIGISNESGLDCVSGVVANRLEDGAK